MIEPGGDQETAVAVDGATEALAPEYIPAPPPSRVQHRSVAQRVELGRAARERTPRGAHAGWQPAHDRPDPVALLESQAPARLPDLVPLRYGRMFASPFAFLRGAAIVMANDLARAPSSGISVQLCGDCHLSNLGAYASPERDQVVDLNDFDETLPGPFEWDIKRLVTSVVVAGPRQRIRSPPGPTLRRSGRPRLLLSRYHVADIARKVVGVGTLSPERLQLYAALCGGVLARAHARAGDRITIASYLGKSERFDDAVTAFAEQYADQTERDHTALATAVQEGRIVAAIEPGNDD